MGAAAFWLILALMGPNAGGYFPLLAFLFIIVVFSLFLGLTIMGKEGIKSVMREEPVVPLTRQTALDIPAEESLVRASSADTLASKTILLRPAHNESETASEQLLRPTPAADFPYVLIVEKRREPCGTLRQPKGIPSNCCLPRDAASWHQNALPPTTPILPDTDCCLCFGTRTETCAALPSVRWRAEIPIVLIPPAMVISSAPCCEV